MTLPVLREIENIDSHILYDGGRETASDWPVQFLVRLQYCDYWEKEWAKDGKYYAAIEAVAPAAPPLEEIKAACESRGCPYDEYEKLDELYQSTVLADYGTKAVLWACQSNHRSKLLIDARKELAVLRFTFGFAMDKNQNALGATGWDFIQGDPTLRRKREEKDE